MNVPILALLFWANLPGTSFAQTVRVFAGGDIGDDRLATEAALNNPSAISVTASGDIYIAETGHDRIRRVDGATGAMTTYAGGGGVVPEDGREATSATLEAPESVVADPDGGVYFGSSRGIWYVNAAGILTRVAGGAPFGTMEDGLPATESFVASPTDLLLSGGSLFYADPSLHVVRKIDLADGTVATVAGTGTAGFSGDDGPAKDADLRNPTGIYVDTTGSVWIADQLNYRTRKVDAAGIIRTVAGNGFGFSFGDGGPVSEASLLAPTDVWVDESGVLTFSELERIRRVNADSIIVTIAGDPASETLDPPSGLATETRLRKLGGLQLLADGTIYVVDVGATRVYRIGSDGAISRVAGGHDGDGRHATEAAFFMPTDVAVDTAGNVYIADSASLRVRRVDALTGIITTAIGNGAPPTAADFGAGYPDMVATDARIETQRVAAGPDGGIYVAHSGIVRKLRPDGILTRVAGGGGNFMVTGDRPATTANLSPLGIHMDSQGNLYITDLRDHLVLKVDTEGVISIVAGNRNQGFSGDGGPATDASLNGPWDVATDAAGNLYILDQFNRRVRKVDPEGVITTAIGNGQSVRPVAGTLATESSLPSASGVAVDEAGNLYVTAQDEIAVVDTAGIVSVINNSTVGTRILFSPSGITVASTGRLLVADSFKQRVLEVLLSAPQPGDGDPDDDEPPPDPTASSMVLTVAGGFFGDGGPATEAFIGYASQLVTDANGNLFIGNGELIRRVDAQTGIITTLFDASAVDTDLSFGPISGLSIDGLGQPIVSWGFRGSAGDVVLADTRLLRIDESERVEVLARDVHSQGSFAISHDGGYYIAIRDSHIVRKLGTDNSYSIVAGFPGFALFGGDGGPATDAWLDIPIDVAVDDDGMIYIAELGNHRVRAIDSDGIIGTVAGGGSSGFTGDGSAATAAGLLPFGIAARNGEIFIAGHNRVRKVGTDGTIQTVAGSGPTVAFNLTGGGSFPATTGRPLWQG